MIESVWSHWFTGHRIGHLPHQAGRQEAQGGAAEHLPLLHLVSDPRVQALAAHHDQERGKLIFRVGARGPEEVSGR